MKTRLLAAVAALALVATMTSGCLAQPDPEPTPAFGSEQEAFAAAEATYRAYVDALNQVDLSDPDTFEPLYALTTGAANANARETFSGMHAKGWAVDGSSVPNVVQPLSSSGENFAEVSLAVCLDVSGVSVIDNDGASMVSADRGDIQSLLITLEPSKSTPTGMAISEFAGREGEPICG